MLYQEHINRQQGNFITTLSGVEFENNLLKEPIRLITGDIFPGEFTTLHDWYIEPCRYCGMLEKNDIQIKQAIFFMGKDQDDLFKTGTYYYDLTYILQPDRIGKCYKPGTFRDCFLKTNKKGYYWK